MLKTSEIISLLHLDGNSNLSNKTYIKSSEFTFGAFLFCKIKLINGDVLRDHDCEKDA